MDEKREPTLDATTLATPNDIGGPNVTLHSYPEAPGSGVNLKALDDEIPAALLRSGREKYQVLRPIGEGGMGKVYAVRDRDLRRPDRKSVV